MDQDQHFDDAEAERVYYPIALATSVLCLVIFRVISPRLSTRLCDQHPHLPHKIRVDWGTRVVSTFHATTVSLLSAYNHLYDHGMHTNLTWWDCPLVRATCAFVVGYMIMDLLIITFYYKYLGEVEYYVHHLASITAYYYIMTYPVVPFFANFRLLSEISTPFLNIRWFLLTLGVKKTSRGFLLNGVLLLVTFLLCRVLAIPAYWRHVHVASLHPAFSRLGHIPVILVITCVVLDTLNVYWFFKLLRSYGKIFLPVLSSRQGSLRGLSSRIGAGLKRETNRVKSG